ncbi:class I SAM-dependent methyltransferase [Actinacidiphila rubida]|uniref:Methyltransferase domain-containing protein n=1 Tax=Actinacidiphila rubida TaxID=310780 RepID=A0A1H8SLM6_9ACTN|nr:class I SAM-dependent methyltransferase [Actinacidiphila rubida]SEO79859.1 Methyltransferase domain-containing protein [Actinacidiphila rubida]
MDQQVHEGQATYNPFTLALYDLFVLGLSCRYVWGCRKSHLVGMFRRGMGGRHLDVGVGTGYLPARGAGPDTTHVTLFDANRHSLHASSQRLKHLQPTTVEGNALEPLPFADAAFDSASANFLFHCMPGTLAEKGVLLQELGRVVRPGGTVFGATILASGVTVTGRARRLMGLYNSKGVFHNSADTLEDLEAGLGGAFKEHTVTVHGCVALFEATVGTAEPEL